MAETAATVRAATGLATRPRPASVLMPSGPRRAEGMRDEEEAMIQVVWEFMVKPDACARFEQAYGPSGPWVRLFQRHSGYRGTALVRDVSHPRRFLTIDSWDSEAQRADMLAAEQAQYARLDRECADLTESEIELGVFAVVSE